MRFEELPGGLRISRDTVWRLGLWLEFVTPTTLLLIAGSAAVWQVRWLAHHAFTTLGREFGLHATYLVGLAAYAGLTIRSSSQNAGKVAEISFADGLFYWGIQTIFGTREKFWPIGSLKEADVQVRTLMIRRHRGVALGAFSFLGADELRQAAKCVNAKIRKHRASHASDQDVDYPLSTSLDPG